MTVPQILRPARASFYLRVSTARRAEHDVSIPDQKRQGEAYCQSPGYQPVDNYVEPGASATGPVDPGGTLDAGRILRRRAVSDTAAWAAAEALNDTERSRK